MKMNTNAIGLLGTLAALSSSNAYGQTAAPQPTPGTPVMVQMPDGTYKQGYAVPATVVQEPKPVPKQFAITTNPLNLYIGRYGINFEYQPTLHHGLILSPHYDHINADVSYSINGQSGTAVDNFSGFGAEIGYRFYSGEKGFNGFFASPSLLVASYKATGPSLDLTTGSRSFTSIGWAWEVGGQAQIGGGFVIGGGGGMQYTKVSKDFTSLPFAAAVVAGGGWRPRILLNLGYAF